ncbi:MAG TPA: type II secretion system protein GspL [Sphingomonas sp.]|nr:type II secretion system protein GspL [Sphingomonas sp.]
MSAGLIVILPPEPDAAPEWLRVEDDAIVARGSGDDWGDAPDGPDTTLLVAPAAAITLHRTAFPDLALRQAAAAARLLALDNSLGGGDTLHVATGPRDPDGGFDVAVVSNDTMAAWLRWAQHHRLDSAAIVPAALLLPRSERIVAGRVGGELLLRDANAAFAADGLGALLVGDAPVETLSPAEIDAALVAALATPPLDLRQGAFARRRRTIEPRLLRRSAVLLGLIVLTVLATALVRIVRLHADTAARDAAAVAAARTIAPTVTTAEQAEAAVNQQLADRGLGGHGFSGPVAHLLSTTEATPDVTLAALARTGDGALAATLAAPGIDEINAVLVALQRAGYRITAEPPQNQGGRNAVAITMAAP